MNATEQEHEHDDSGALGASNEGEAATGAVSILDRIKERREAATHTRWLDLAIPGYGDDLMARYKPVPYKVFEQAEKKQRRDKSAPKLLLAGLDQIILTCDMILVKDPGHEACVTDNEGAPTDYRPIDVEAADNNFPVKWEPRLAQLIGIPEDEYKGDPRQVILRTFCNDAAVIHHATQIGVWLRDTTKDLDETLLGE
jgi:hypothetical protein